MAYLDFKITENKLFKSSYPQNTTITIPAVKDITSLSGGIAPYYGKSEISVTDPNGEKIEISSTVQGGGGGGSYTFPSLSGTYQIRYNGYNVYQYISGDNVGHINEDYSFYYQVAVVENKLPLKRWTITDVINRLLDVAEPIRSHQAPRFRLNAEQAEKFDKILAPEFSFTKQTLRECLQQIGGFIHGEPRLKPVRLGTNSWIYEVYYDMFAGQDNSDIQYMAYANKGQQHVIEHYLGWIDSNAENLVNQLDKLGGVVVEPYEDGAKSVRTENLYVRIEEGNMLIPTQYPIYTVDKLEWVAALYDEVNGRTILKSVDITPYVFEKSEYDGRLSSFDGTYPYTKMYALYFSQGSKNIEGLNFKVPDASTTLAPFKDYAITNILKQVSGDDSLTLDYAKLYFRVTYTPFYNARVGQTKTYYKDFKRPAALIYNQTSNLVESRAYGENLKGAVARLGNTEISLTYHLYMLYEIPKAGLKFDEHFYVSAVATEILPTMIKCTVGLSRDFNRLSQYIGVSSVKRYYEVSQNQAVERRTLYREYMVIGEKENADGDTLTGGEMLALIAALFSPPKKEGALVPFGPVTNVVAWGTSYNGAPNNAVNLPVITSAFGNSISFSWKYEDNYSAGATAQYQSNDKVTGYFQQSLPYGDYYGRLYYYNFDLQLTGTPSTLENYEQLGLELPKGTIPTKSSQIVSTIGNTPYIMRKDNREALQVNFQIDFVTNLENMIIGSALASYCPAVRGTDDTITPKLYVFPTELNKFTDHVEAFEDVDLSKLPSADITATVQDGYLVITAGNFPASGKSWAIVTAQRAVTQTVESEDGTQTEQTTYYGGDLLLGQNTEVQSGQEFTPIYFTRKTQIFDTSVWKDRW